MTIYGMLWKKEIYEREETDQLSLFHFLIDFHPTTLVNAGRI